MTEKAQEDMYFYKINKELIQYLRDIKLKSPDAMSSKSIASNPSNKNHKTDSLYDFLEEHLQPDLRWHVDICY